MSPSENNSAKVDRDLLRTVLLITSVTFLGVLRFEFVYDDNTLIVNNPFVRSWKFLPQYFANSMWKLSGNSQNDNYYRPLFLVWTRLNYALFAGRPFGWHLATLVLYIAATWLVYRVIRQMCGRSDLAWITALVFGVHPIHHEVVAWVCGMTESLYAVLFLAAFLAYLRFRESSKTPWMLLSCGLYGLAMLCKETAIVLPALIFTHGWVSDNLGEQIETAKRDPEWKRSFRATLWYIPVALIYLPIRYKVLSGFSRTGANAGVFEWFLTLPSILLLYVKHWFLPIHLSPTYDLYYQKQLSLAHVILPAAILVAIGMAVWLVRQQLGTREVAYAVAWIVIPLLPALDTLVLRPDTLAQDRYLYMPSVGAALLVALIISRLGRTSRAIVFGQPMHVVVAGFALAVVLSICAIRETNYWRDDFALFAHAHEIARHNATATNNLGAQLIDRGDIDIAQTLLEAGYREHSDYRLAFNLGRVYYIKKEYAEAERYTRRALDLEPNFPEAHVSMAQIQLKELRPQEAQVSLRRAVELNPYSAPFHTSYGIVLALNGDCPAATRQFEAALDLNPGDFTTNMQLLRCQSLASPAATPASKPGQL